VIPVAGEQLVATGIDSGQLINFGTRVTVRRKFGTPGKNPVNLENPVNPVLLEHCDERSDETAIACSRCF